ncbi:MAG: apolipoprotein N-acyltransferase, partial [Emcibacteraceae bacterium]|nr:apolipoprotein N-acyltransferase [Emcibacteraceae bacterium]
KFFHRNHQTKTHLLNMVITFTLLWNALEWIRGVLFSGFPWNLSGYLWGFSDVMLQSTAVWGIYGLGVFTVLFCLFPLLMLDPKWRYISPSAVILMVGSLFYYGDNRLPESIEFVEDVNLRVIQANIQQADKWPYENWSKNLIQHMDMSEDELNKSEGRDIIIWPETAAIYSLSEEPMRRDLIANVIGKGELVLTGFPRRQRDPDKTRIYNSLIAIDENGDVDAVYDKSHLVPFGEYIPNFIQMIMIPLGLDQIFTGGQGFSHGEGVKTLDLSGMPPVGVLICYEVIFPGQIVDHANRPDWLLNITNDAWYGESTGPHQHLLQTRVRAIEEGLPLVRSASTGISAVIDPYGRIIKDISLNKRGVINSQLPRKLATETLYSNYKEWIIACIGVILIIANLVFVRRKALSRR